MTYTNLKEKQYDLETHSQHFLVRYLVGKSFGLLHIPADNAAKAKFIAMDLLESRGLDAVILRCQDVSDIAQDVEHVELINLIKEQ